MVEKQRIQVKSKPQGAPNPKDLEGVEEDQLLDIQ